MCVNSDTTIQEAISIDLAMNHERMHPRDLLLQERLRSTMSAKGQLRRFENRAQLLRHISEETGTDIDTLWDEYEAQVE